MSFMPIPIRARHLRQHHYRSAGAPNFNTAKLNYTMNGKNAYKPQSEGEAERIREEYRELRKAQNPDIYQHDLEIAKTWLKNMASNFPDISVKDLLDASFYRYEIDLEGRFVILSKNFEPKFRGFSFHELGINEDKFFENISGIDGNANFADSKVKQLKNLRFINGNANFSNSQISDLPKLYSISGDADFIDSEVTNLSGLRIIGGNVYLQNSLLTPQDFSSVNVKGQIKTLSD